MSCGIRIVCGIDTYGLLAIGGGCRRGMCPLVLKAEAFGISSSEVSVLHQFLSVSSIHFLLTCSPSAFNYMYLNYTTAL